MSTIGPAGQRLITVANENSSALPQELAARLSDGRPSNGDLRWLKRVASHSAFDAFSAFCGYDNSGARIRAAEKVIAAANAAKAEQGSWSTLKEGIKDTFSRS